MSATIFIEMYHPALPGTPHVLAPLQAEDLYAAKGWLVVDGATPVSASEFITPLAGDLRYVQHWQPSLAVTATQVFVAPDAHLIQRIADGTTRPTYDATEQALWTIVSGGGGAVSSVAGRTGVVVLSTSDISGLGSAASQASSAFDTAGAAALRAPLLVPTATKTASYTAAAGDLAMMNAAGGGSTLTLPTAPADKSHVGYRAIGATGALPLTVNRGGSTDTIGTAGATSLTVALTDEVAVLQYDAANTRWLAVANVKTQASLDASYRSAPTPGPVSGAYQVQQFASNGTDTGVNTMVKHTLPATVGMEVIRLRFSNSGAASNGDVDNANAVTVVCSVGTSTTGPWFPVRRNGSRTMVLDAGADVETDPMAFHVAAGGTFYTKTFLSVTSGQTWSQQNQPGAAGTDYWMSQSAGETDLSQSTAAFTATTGTRPYGPTTVLADLPPTTARVAIIGDSISGGLGDTLSGSTSSRGFVHRALSGVLAWTRIAVSGSKVQNLVDPAVGRRRLVLIRGCNVATIMYGTNDIFTATRTLAQVQADHITLWQILRNMGIKPTECTLVPQTTSTDSWATTANQTTKTGETVRTGFNDWLRDGAPMLSGAAVATGSNAAGTVRAGQSGHTLAGYFETADVAETARNSGLWKVNGTSNFATADGTHPTTAIHTNMAAVITPATFTALAAA